MSGSVKNMGKSLVKSETLLNIVVPNSLSPNSAYIFLTAHKAGFLRRFHFGGFGLFGNIRRRLALFVFVHNSNFCSQMPNSHKNLQLAVNNSTRTASAKAVKPAVSKRYYQVHFRAQRINLGVSNLECSHPFLATSREEAVGMAIDYLVGKWPHYNLLAETITCYPLNLKSAAL